MYHYSLEIGRRSSRLLLIAAIALTTSFISSAQTPPTSLDSYKKTNAFVLNGGKADVTNLVLKRDRVSMTFNGTFYFPEPVHGKVTGAVFVGRGTMTAPSPPSDFEKANVRRLLKADGVSSDFSSAVLRFSDDTFETIGKSKQEGQGTSQAQKLAIELGPRFLEETGVNLAARTFMSSLNNEPGFFFAEFDGGSLGRFSYVLDPLGRIPTADFGLNGGEKGLIYSHRSGDIWMAFYSEQDYARGIVAYSDMFDFVDVESYKIDLDLRTPKSKIGLRAVLSMKARFDGIKVVPFSIGESLGEAEDQRLKKQMRITGARLGSAKLEFVQEDWEGGFIVFLPSPTTQGQQLELEIEAQGDFLRQSPYVQDVSYPRSNHAWYPRHGYLDRSTYDLTYRHRKSHKIGSIGTRYGEAASPEDSDVVVTRYRMTSPVALVTFALGPWQRHSEAVKWDGSDKEIPLEFNSLPGSHMAIKEDFILAELNNSVRYFHALFGAYPYETYSATVHPYGFGQGFPSMLMIPPTDRASKYTYAFIAHETAHQWWGNIVSWRSYRDQWLSEGFAEYSGVLYTALREDPKAARSLVTELRESIKRPPVTQTGIGSGRLNDVGPIILGHRLSTTKTYGAYQALIYNKGALVLRMLHFLMSDPGSGNDKAFFDMMKDFVEKHRNGAASTDDFRRVASEHFSKSPIGQKYKLNDLNWFFRQWVYNVELPAYRLEYTMQDQPDGSVTVSGNVFQEGVGANFFMPLPLVFTYGNNRHATGTVHAIGPKTPFQIKLPSRPAKVELDPNRWVLSEKTDTK